MKLLKQAATVLALSLSVFGFAEKGFGEDRLRMYVLDGGGQDVSDMSDFSYDGLLGGQAAHLTNPIFLIRHPEGDLLWDTGYEDELADIPDGMNSGVYHRALDTKLIDQLEQLQLQPKDIRYLALSHLHPDHSGNANLFKDSTLIINELEHRYMFSEEAMAMFGSSYSELETAKTITFSDEYDVFGDGTVIIISMPGHTPGSSVLLVRLENSGNLLLSGDLYTHDKAREMQSIPTFNTDRQATLNSRKKFEELAVSENARVVVQHSKADFDKLPRVPNFLD